MGILLSEEPYIRPEVLEQAMLDPWEEALLAEGSCPKCAAKLAMGEEAGLKFIRCVSCDSAFVTLA